MPTGYTAAVQDGKITSLREYAMACARAFGALISMRDCPSDAPIPDRLEPHTSYYDERIADAQARLAELPRLTADECDVRSEAEYRQALSRHTEANVERARQKSRYENMLAKVREWRAPEELSGLKDFMTEQLTQSIDHDCSESYRPAPPVRLTGEAWREQALASASRDIAYSLPERQKEIDRTNDRQRWLDSLRGSLPPVEVPTS